MLFDNRIFKKKEYGIATRSKGLCVKKRQVYISLKYNVKDGIGYTEKISRREKYIRRNVTRKCVSVCVYTLSRDIVAWG